MNPPVAPTPVRAVLIGAAGRMGQALLQAAAACDSLVFTAALVSRDSALVGSRAAAGALQYRADLAAALAGADVAIDFSSAAATAGNLAACTAAGTPLLIGTTGWAAALEADFAAAARAIPLLVAANTSIAVTVLSELVRSAAAALPPQFAVRITESHHAGKRDAPSGTALVLAAAVRQARAATASGAGAPDIESIRAGDIVGEHAVRFAASGEELTLAHKASDRGVFAAGALAAALWLSAQPPGRYLMRDVLAMKTAT
jgi:4-hydroxy-tetrahydrodipicolinate reductase